MDNDGWLVELENGQRKIVLTHHDNPYFAEPKELSKKIEQYQKLIISYKKVLNTMKGKLDE